MKAIISDEKIKIKYTQKELTDIRNKNILSIGYDIYLEKNGVIFGKNLLSGDRMDYWANHFYYIAIRKKDRKILGTNYKIYGWQGKSGDNESVLDWRKRMVEIAKELK